MSSSLASSSSDSLGQLIFELSKLPGIGDKTAARLAYHILKQDVSYAQSLSQSILNARAKLGLCGSCMAFTDIDPCRICSQPQREQSSICVVEKPSDIPPIESSGNYRGLYHVLHGVLSPLDSVGPDELKIRELLARMPRTEVILALNPTLEGDATALYLSRLLRPLGVRVTRLAHGIPVGGRLEFSDRQTIGKAIENRMEIH